MIQEKITIALTKLQAIVIDSNKGQVDHLQTVLTLNAELMNLGYILSQELTEILRFTDKAFIIDYAHIMIPVLQKQKGSDVIYSPMYPNFPEQVINAEEIALYVNAINHYWSCGQWMPSEGVISKKFDFEQTKFIEIGVTTEQTFKHIFTQLLRSQDSLSDEDKKTIAWFITNTSENELLFPEDIPFVENKCLVAAELLTQGKSIEKLVKTSTDILRIVTYISGGDISLAKNTSFKSLPRSMRKILVALLENVINEEDIGRHKNKWVRLFHALHVGDYSKKVYTIAKKARNNLQLKSFNGTIEYYLSIPDIARAVDLLRTRPGEFGRRLDQLLRLAHNINNPSIVVDGFLSISENIPTRNLLQLIGHLYRRKNDIEKRVVFPKGNVQKAVIIRRSIKGLDPIIINDIIKNIRRVLVKRFSHQPSLGKVWIDPNLIDCPLPSQQRSASNALFNVARGTRLPIGEKATLRFFIYWIGRDIDLSATLHADDFSIVEHISYTNLRSHHYCAYHSGDITSAPNGASEFIDITLDGLYKKGIRFITMNVLVYNGPTFAEHQTCYAGWMTRDKPNCNEIYDPKTVAQKIDVRSGCKNVIPVVFDVRDRKAIWVDVATSSQSWCGGNNIESNSASIQEKLEAVTSLDQKISLYELFDLHTQARGEQVSTPEEADTVFSITQGITPYHINDINADYLQ